QSVGYGGGRADRRRSRREGHGLFGRRIPDREPRDGGVEWVGARRAFVRISGNLRGPGIGGVAQSGHLRERSKIVMERWESTRPLCKRYNHPCGFISA